MPHPPQLSEAHELVEGEFGGEVPYGEVTGYQVAPRTDSPYADSSVIRPLSKANCWVNANYGGELLQRPRIGVSKEHAALLPPCQQCFLRHILHQVSCNDLKLGVVNVIEVLGLEHARCIARGSSELHLLLVAELLPHVPLAVIYPVSVDIAVEYSKLKVHCVLLKEDIIIKGAVMGPSNNIFAPESFCNLGTVE